ncbi:MAG: hypothetical protein KAG84_01940 [Bacteroidales bacterium]|nr:hypothetical protein [Bacteroidales bacterium]
MAEIQERLKNKAYSEYSYATRPTKFTLFIRRCLLFQIFMFFKLNLKIMMMVVKGHS